MNPTYMLFARLLSIVSWLIQAYTWVIIAAVIASWLIAFGVLNMHNHVVRSLVQALWSITEPVFRRVRRVVPPIGGLDLSPLIVIIGLQVLLIFLQYLLAIAAPHL